MQKTGEAGAIAAETVPAVNGTDYVRYWVAAIRWKGTYNRLFGQTGFTRELVSDVGLRQFFQNSDEI